MNLVDKIIMALECSEVYAQKMIKDCNGSVEEIRQLVEWKLEEKRERKGVVEYDPRS